MSGAGAFCCALVLASHPTLNATTTAAVIITIRMDRICLRPLGLWRARPVAACHLDSDVSHLENSATQLFEPEAHALDRHRLARGLSADHRRRICTVHWRVDRQRHRRPVGHRRYLVGKAKSAVATRLDLHCDALALGIGPQPRAADAELCVRVSGPTDGW